LGVAQDILNDPDIKRDKEKLKKSFRSNRVTNYGYDELGNEDDSEVDGPKHPVFGAVYINEKTEIGDLVVNAGLRVDYIDMDGWKLANPRDPAYLEKEQNVDPKGLKKSEASIEIQPRLGFAFPVTDRSVFHVQYGKFAQAPDLARAYGGRPDIAQLFRGQFFINDPVGFGLEPITTTQYEIGYNQQFTDFASFDITGFYKDIKGQIQIDKQFPDPLTGDTEYSVYKNGDFGTTKGFEFTLKMRRVQRIQAQVTYTLSDARGTNSFPNASVSAIERAQRGIGSPSPTLVSPLRYNSTHSGNVNFDYRFGKGDGGIILEQLGVNLLFTFNSGFHFTRSGGSGGQRDRDEGSLLNDRDPRSRVPLEPIGSSTTPWTFNFDLRLDKTISMFGVNANVYFYVQNLLNTQNVTNVYEETGNAYDDGFLTNPNRSQKIVEAQGQKYKEMYEAVNLKNRQHYWRDYGYDLFSPPRQIRAGIRFDL
jgi:hypothetical protein